VSNWLIEPVVFNGSTWFVKVMSPPTIESAGSTEQVLASKTNGRNDLNKELKLCVN
jgi:hypothetical protein